MTEYDNILICKLCNYKSKQLHQHLKAVHKITSSDYRKLYGKNQKMQYNFNPLNSNDNKSVDRTLSEKTKKYYNNINTKLSNIHDTYTIQEIQYILSTKQYNNMIYGKGNYRKLVKHDFKLYSSILFHTNIYNNYFKKITFINRVNIILNNFNDKYIKCKCGNKYTFSKYCTKCPDRPNKIGKPHTEESRKKLRISTLSYIKKTKGQVIPRYNIHSIKIIENYGKDNNLNFMHAENGGEYYIKELGYYVDAYDPINNVVLEIYEKHHYNNQGDILEKDKKRELQIKDFLKCKYIIIKYE
jgi:hypothetical protein